MDDETFVVVRWNGWDATFRFDLYDDTERHRVKRTIRARVARILGESTAEALGLAMAEALYNVQHAYRGNGPVTIRFRREGDRCRVEIEDEGRGDTGDGGGFVVMRHWADSVEIRRRYPSGTVISLAVTTKEERNG